MNYAALIALLAALAFFLPFVVRLSENLGVSRGYAVTGSLIITVGAAVGVLLRQRVLRLRAEAKLETIAQQRAAAPNDSAAFFVQGDHSNEHRGEHRGEHVGEHLGDVLLSLGRRTEALHAFELYLPLARAQGHDTTAISRAVTSLRAELQQEEVHASV